MTPSWMTALGDNVCEVFLLGILGMQNRLGLLLGLPFQYLSFGDHGENLQEAVCGLMHLIIQSHVYRALAVCWEL